MKMKKVVRMPLRRPPQRTRPPAASLRARAATAEEAYDEDEDYGGEEEPNMKFSHAVLVVLILHVIAVAGIFAFNSIKARQTVESRQTASKPVQSEPAAPAQPVASAATVVEKPRVEAGAISGWTGKTHTIQPGDTLTRVASQYGITIAAIEKENAITSYSTLHVGQVLKIPAGSSSAEAKNAPSAKAPATSAVKPSAGSISSVPKVVASSPPAAAPVKAAASPAPAAKTVATTSTQVSDDVYVVAKGDNPYSIAKKLHVDYTTLLSLNNIEDPRKIQIGQKLKIPQKAN